MTGLVDDVSVHKLRPPWWSSPRSVMIALLIGLGLILRKLLVNRPVGTSDDIVTLVRRLADNDAHMVSRLGSVFGATLTIAGTAGCGGHRSHDRASAARRITTSLIWTR